MASEAEEEEELSLTEDAAELGRALWSTILGLCFARCSIIVGSYGSYRATDYGIYTDGATLVTMAVLLAFLVVIVVKKVRLHKKQVAAIMRGCIGLQIVVLVAMAALAALPDSSSMQWLNGQPVHYFLHVCNSVLGLMMVSFWLRYMRGSNAFTSVGIVAIALIISEVVLLITAFVPYYVSYAVAAFLTVAEAPMMWQARRVPRPYEVGSDRVSGLLLSFARETGEQDDASRRRFLINMGISIGAFSIVIGLLRGYPDGASIPFTTGTRLAYFALIVVLLGLAVRGAHKGRRQMVTVDAWLIMQALACASLVLLAFFPDALEIGAVTTTVLNALMVGFTFYAIVAFMGYGWRDPYYYAIGGLTVFLVPRAAARMVEMALFGQLGLDAVEIGSIIACGLVISCQLGLLQMAKLAERAHDRQRAEEYREEKANLLERVMGLDNEDAPESLEDLRLRAMKDNAAKMGKEFLLSDRETEVLALYAMGHTQKKVGEELFISPGTVHAHIKRIYSKTGLHSRQEILDYMDKLEG